jgi:hypothetical protein
VGGAMAPMVGGARDLVQKMSSPPCAVRAPSECPTPCPAPPAPQRRAAQRAPWGVAGRRGAMRTIGAIGVRDGASRCACGRGGRGGRGGHRVVDEDVEARVRGEQRGGEGTHGREVRHVHLSRAACPLSTGPRTRRVRLVRRGGGGPTPRGARRRQARRRGASRGGGGGGGGGRGRYLHDLKRAAGREGRGVRGEVAREEAVRAALAAALDVLPPPPPRHAPGMPRRTSVLQSFLSRPCASGGTEEGAGARLKDCGARVLAALHGAHREDDRRAVGVQRGGRRAPDPRARARDDRHLPAQVDRRRLRAHQPEALCGALCAAGEGGRRSGRGARGAGQALRVVGCGVRGARVSHRDGVRYDRIRNRADDGHEVCPGPTKRHTGSGDAIASTRTLCERTPAAPCGNARPLQRGGDRLPLVEEREDILQHSRHLQVRDTPSLHGFRAIAWRMRSPGRPGGGGIAPPLAGYTDPHLQSTGYHASRHAALTACNLLAPRCVSGLVCYQRGLALLDPARAHLSRPLPPPQTPACHG